MTEGPLIEVRGLTIKVDEAVVQAVTQRLKGYEALTPQGRADSLRGRWKHLGETYPEAQQKPKDQPRPQPRPRPPQEPRPQQPPAPRHWRALYD